MQIFVSKTQLEDMGLTVDFRLVNAAKEHKLYWDDQRSGLYGESEQMIKADDLWCFRKGIVLYAPETNIDIMSNLMHVPFVKLPEPRKIQIIHQLRQPVAIQQNDIAVDFFDFARIAAPIYQDDQEQHIRDSFCQLAAEHRNDDMSLYVEQLPLTPYEKELLLYQYFQQ